MTISRRIFLRNASVGVAAAGTAAAAPGLMSLAGTELSSDGAAVGSLPSVEGPIVAHVVDASTGTVAVYHGTEEVIVHNPSLVSALHAALR